MRCVHIRPYYISSDQIRSHYISSSHTRLTRLSAILGDIKSPVQSSILAAHACTCLAPRHSHRFGPFRNQITVVDLSQHLVPTLRGFDGAATVLHMVTFYRTADLVKLIEEVSPRQGMFVDA